VPEEVLLEGEGTRDEMEVRLITELRERRWLTLPGILDCVFFEERPADGEKGRYRIRIVAPPPR